MGLRLKIDSVAPAFPRPAQRLIEAQWQADTGLWIVWARGEDDREFERLEGSDLAVLLGVAHDIAMGV